MPRVNKIRTNDPQGLRGRVLDAAASAFQAGGYAATSIHDIVRQAGVTGGALHHHFPSKKDLVLAVIAERVAGEIEQTWIRQVREAPSAAEGVLHVFEDVAAALEARGAVTGCLLNNLAVELSLADPDLRTALAAQYALWREAIAERLTNEKACFASDPAAFANVIVSMFSGAMAIAKAEQRPVALRDCADILRQLMRV
jgi:AcrR family transcriptional regulator